MKKIFVSMFLIFTLAGFCIADDCPSPFAKIKEYALKGQIMPSGAYLFIVRANEDGREVQFRFRYFPGDQSICIGGSMEEGYKVFCWAPEVGCAQLLGYGFSMLLDDAVASEEVYKIFRRAVGLGLL